MLEPTAVSLPKLLTADVVSAELSIPKHRIYELCRRNQIPHVRLGRTVRFNATALAEWLNNGGTGYVSPDRDA